MNLSIRQLRYICTVAQHGSVQAASRHLAISQSSIIAAIDAAEHVASTRLFDRRPAIGLAPTPSGRSFVREALALLASADAFDRAVKQQSSGMPAHIRIGCFEPFGAMFMPTVIRRYLDIMGPAEVSLLEGDHVQLANWLATGAVDFALAYDIGPDLGQSSTPICRLPAHAVLARGNPLAGRARVSLEDLVENPFILLDLPHTGHYLLNLFNHVSRRPTISLRTRSYETVRCAVAAGFGMSILNMRPLNTGLDDTPGLIRVPLSDDLAAPALQVVDIYGAHKPMFVRRFIEIVHEFFARLGPARFAVATPERHGELLFPLHAAHD
ncbi:MAG: transcriptional regulator [Acidiphilium sp. 37-64-53]|uniref:LysR family transcriptional regulator n=1 Tax=Acidiphilium TaxID=522 RepID=UPI000BCCC1D4|nr:MULTISPECIES: LysR family transcriptional regulator [Acidiphilium]OYW00452.1 MAG: transcriptional regulator [Acidiphilium sp. 37-64-53]OZB29454.1 MAG: transcriptional regulator [Acidiphilium sp. 34-64-41]HQT85865.1 LysR family transcriptional regulator [Acidiphilium rubrum]